MLRICISGLAESGKTTIGSMLAEKLNIMHITKYNINAYKEFKKSGKDNDKDFRILQMATREYAGSFDDEIARVAAANDCVVTTWIGPWIVKEPTLRIWLSTPYGERVKRNMGEGYSQKDAEEYIKRKDEMNIRAFREIYNIDIMDHSDFDMEINTAKFTNEQAVSLISMVSIEKEGNRFR